MRYPSARRIAVALMATMGFPSRSTSDHREHTETRKLFYAVGTNFSSGRDFPKSLPRATPDDLFGAIAPTTGKAFALATFTLGGERGYFLTTMFVFTKDGEGVRGWNVVINRDGNGVTERKFISPSNGEVADVVLSDVLYAVATEVAVAATNKNLGDKELDEHLKPTLDWLQSLL